MGLEGIGKLLVGGAVLLLVLGGVFLLLGRLAWTGCRATYCSAGAT